MARPEREYRRLPGRGRKRGSFFALAATRAGLWAGKDHVLCVYATGYTEEYKRFYYRDIQAIVMRKTGRGAVWSVVSALFLSLFALLVITRTTPALAVVYWILGGFFLLVLAGNLLLGPTCNCYLQTAVSREELPSLGRVRNARKAVNILKPLIEAVQGLLAPDEVVSRSAELGRQPGPAPWSRAVTPPAGTVGGYGGKAHETLFYLLLLDGLMSGTHIFVQGVPVFILGTLFTIGFSIAVIIALTKQHGSGLSTGLRRITWTAFIYMAATWVSSYAVSIYEVVKNPAAARMGQWELFKTMSHVSPAENRVLMFVLVFSVICAILLGISGLVLLKKFQAGRKASSDPPLSADSVASTRTGQ